MSRAILFAGALHIVTVAAAAAQDPVRAQAMTLEEARTLARQNHPAILAARKAVKVAEGLERQAGAFANPTLSYTREQTSTNGGTNWQNVVMFAQPFEIGGQRGTRSRVANQRRAAEEARFDEVEAQMNFEVGRAYALALAADYRLARTAEAAAVFLRAREISTQRLRQGDISGFENRRITLEAGRYAALEAEMTLERHESRLALATLLSPTSDSVHLLANQIRLVDSIPTVQMNHPLDSLITLAFQHRSDLQAAGFELDASNTEVRLASRQAVPSITMAIGFKNERAATDMGSSKGFALQVSLPVPLWNRQGGATDAARAHVRMVEARREHLRINIVHEIEVAWSMWATASEQLDVLQPLLGSEAQIALQAAAAGYAEGEISLIEWLDAVRAYHEAEASFATLRANLIIRSMTLERAVGTVLSEGVGQ